MAMGMKSDQKGVRIRRIDPTSPESQVLKPSDVILSFDGVDIANDGTGEYLCFSFFIRSCILCSFICSVATKTPLMGGLTGST
jgi:hypothetical protein